jgi:hypothetical protein
MNTVTPFSTIPTSPSTTPGQQGASTLGPAILTSQVGPVASMNAPNAPAAPAAAPNMMTVPANGSSAAGQVAKAALQPIANAFVLFEIAAAAATVAIAVILYRTYVDGKHPKPTKVIVHDVGPRLRGRRRR